MTRLHPFNPTEVAESGGSVSNGKQSYLEEISAYAANERKRGQRRNAALPGPIRPTPERLAKVEAHEEILVPMRDEDTRATHKVTRLLSVFDAHKARMPQELVSALQTALDDFSKALVQNGSLVSSYGDGGGSVPGPRHGGVPDHVREAFSRIVALQAYMGPRIFRVFVAYVCEVAMDKRRRAGVSPWGDKATNKGLFWGWDAATLEMLAEMVLNWQTRERALKGATSSNHEVTLRRMARQERVAKEGRR